MPVISGSMVLTGDMKSACLRISPRIQRTTVIAAGIVRYNVSIGPGVIEPSKTVGPCCLRDSVFAPAHWRSCDQGE